MGRLDLRDPARDEDTSERIAHLGGSMYGDGTFVVEFCGSGSMLGPMKAYVVGDPLDGVAEVGFEAGATAGVKSARIAIDAVRREVARQEGS